MRSALALAALLGTALLATAMPGVAGQDTLATVLQLDSVANGYASTRAGRVFLPLSRLDGSAGPQVVEWKKGKPIAFPDEDWNGWKPGDDPAKGFVRVNALRIGPRGSLWVVDVGAPGLGKTPLPGGPKLIKIDLAANKVARVYPLDAATNPKSFIDDVRFHGNLAYVTDAGSPGVIVVDLATGRGAPRSRRRSLDDRAAPDLGG